MTIKERHEDIAKRLRKHDAARKVLEGELLALQHECEHPNMESWVHYDYGGGSDHNTSCPDCGRRTYS
jgi:hypothetical protein